MICPECGYNNKEDVSSCFACGFAFFKTVMQGRYILLKTLGIGGMGKVFLAEDKKMKSKVVVKQTLDSQDMEEEKRIYFENRMIEEAKLLYRLNHPSLPKVMDYFIENKSIYLTMQWIEGENFKEILKKQPQGKIPLDKALFWMDALLEVVGFLHSQNPPIIHRDIKPGNMMLSNTGQFFLVDFGIAREVDTADRELTKVGTCEYAAPEQYIGKSDQRSDIYSIGASFYHLITGLAPSDRTHPESYPPLSNYVPDAPKKLAEILGKMTAFNNSDRYDNCEQIRRELREDPQLSIFLFAAGNLAAEPNVLLNIKEAIDNNININLEILQDKSFDTNIDKSFNNNEDESSSDVLDLKEIKVLSKDHLLKVLLVLIILGTFFFVLRNITMGIFQSKEKVEYNLQVSTADVKNNDIIKHVLADNGYEFKKSIGVKFAVTGSFYKVVTYFDSRTEISYGRKKLTEMGYNPVLFESAKNGIYLQVYDRFKNKVEAEEKTHLLNSRFELLQFESAEFPIVEPKPVYKYLITGISKIKDAENIKQKLLDEIKDIDVLIDKSIENTANRKKA